MSPQMFWNITPRKFTSLCLVHADLNDPDTAKKGKRRVQEEITYVDQLSFL